MTSVITKQTLVEAAYITGHFDRLAAGTHSDAKLECDNISSDPRLLQASAERIGELVATNFLSCTTLLTIGNGGNEWNKPIVNYLRRRKFNITGRQTIKHTKPKSLYKFYIPSGAVHLDGEKVVFADDAYNHGTSILEASRLVNDFGGIVLGAVTLFSRDGKHYRELTIPDTDKRFPVLSAIALDIPDWEAGDCTNPKCITELGGVS